MQQTLPIMAGDIYGHRYLIHDFRRKKMGEGGRGAGTNQEVQEEKSKGGGFDKNKVQERKK